MAEEATHKAVVLTSKGGGDYHVIDLVEMVRKVVTVILNHRFTASITFHNILHGLRAGRGTSTNSLKAKLLQKLMSTREDFLYAIFLDLYKAYVAWDREIFLVILDGHGIGPSSHHILRTYCYRLQMVDRAGGYYGATFQGFQGVIQGYLLTPPF